MLRYLESSQLRTNLCCDSYSNDSYMDEAESNEGEEKSDLSPVTISVEILKKVYQNFVDVGSSYDSYGRRKCLKYTPANKTPKIDCIHLGRDQTCEVSKLTEEDVQFFFDHLYENQSKIDQDRYILQFIDVCEPRRRRPRIKNGPEKSRLVMSYFVYNKNGDKFKVCARSFESICCISRSRINRLSKRFYFTHEMPVERRGGNIKKDLDIDRSIINHISSFHGHIKWDNRMSVRKMWTMWKNDQKTQRFAVIPYSHYLSIYKQYSPPFIELCEDISSKIKDELSDYDEEQSVELDSECINI